MPYALLSAPGLNPIISTITGAVRGAWVLPGNLTALFVVAATCYLATVTTPATQTSIAQFSIQAIGTLLTNAGRVVIRDNGVVFNGLGGYAVLVDGVNGYFFRIAGAGNVTFTGNLTSGQPTISFTAGQLVPNYLLISPTASIKDGNSAIPTTTIQSISFTANTITLNANSASNQTADTFTLSIPQFGQINDPAFLGASRIAFIEGWLIFNQPGTRTFYTNAPVPYTLTFAGAFYALKDSSTDNLVTLHENNRELWLVGERTSEVWYNAGGTNFAFARLPGVGPQMGSSAQHSIMRLGPNLAWLAQNEQGQNQMVMTQQYTVVPISNHAIENAVSSYPLVADCIADCYEDRGHIMGVFTFPVADVTWCFDLKVWNETQGEAGWWQRLSWDSTNGVFHRHRGSCFVNFANLRLWGDYQTGQIHQQDRGIYTDAGQVLRGQRRTPHVWSREDRNRIFQASLQVEFKAGTGLQTGQGSSPQAMIRWSDDGGQTWNGEVWAPIGAAGVTRDRAMVMQLGEARDRIYEVNVTDPVSRDIIGATVFGERQEKNG